MARRPCGPMDVSVQQDDTTLTVCAPATVVCTSSYKLAGARMLRPVSVHSPLRIRCPWERIACRCTTGQYATGSMCIWLPKSSIVVLHSDARCCGRRLYLAAQQDGMPSTVCALANDSSAPFHDTPETVTREQYADLASQQC